MTIVAEMKVVGGQQLEKAVKSTSKIKDNTKDINKNLEKSEDAWNKAFQTSKKLEKSDSVLAKINNKITDLSSKRKALNDVGGSAGFISGHFLDMGEKIKKATGVSKGLGDAFNIVGESMKKSAMSGKGFISSTYSGLKSLGSAMLTGKIGVIGLTKSMWSLFVAEQAALWPLTLIAGALSAVGALAGFVFGKLFKNNIGGIQTSFSKMIGTVKTLWGQFNVYFIEKLRELEPYLKPIIEWFETSFMKALKSSIPIIKFMIDVFVGGLKIIFKAFNGISGLIKSAGISMLTTLNPILGIMTKGYEIYKSIKGEKTAVANADSVNAGQGIITNSNSNVNNINNKSDITFNVSTPTTVENTQAFGNMLNKTVITGM